MDFAQEAIMHRWIMGVAMLAFVAAPATADVDAFATIYKDKDITIQEWITITKTVEIDVTVVSEPDSVAEAFALVNQTNNDNEACENCAEKSDTISDSAVGNSGIITVNQAAGNNTNQGDDIAIAIDRLIPGGGGGGGGTDSFAHAQAHVEQDNNRNDVDAVEILFRDALITSSFNFNSGVVHANQSTGNNNNQANALSMAVGLSGEGVAMAEADLGQTNCGNTNFESQDGATPFDGINKTAVIAGSVSNNSGIVGVNQSSGNNGNQANVVAFAVATQ
jgi:hypothetical protein